MDCKVVLSDEALEGIGEIARLQEQVRSRLRGQVSDLRLLLRDGGLILQGQARTFYAKQLAQHAVMTASRRAIRANEIRVP
jgi:hypothetical protein